jgi:23S rRNA (cytidine1920-2'-O)/16S rRNA (cytidine1409-2'-O)-methyltransferase
MAERKERLDRLLVERGLAETRERARALILAGDVRVDGQTVNRPSASVPPTAEVSVAAPPPYVSRGGLKLAHALEAFGLDVTGRTLVDVGASTGGFTDALLKRGAQRVYAVDVGYGQLAWSLRTDARVVPIERTNVRYLTALPGPIDAAVIDVSFISLALVLPSVVRLVPPGGWIVALVKPQFEVGRGQVGKGGVVREPALHRQALVGVLRAARDLELAAVDCTPSPILGPAGNREFLVLLRREPGGLSPDEAADRCLGPATV